MEPGASTGAKKSTSVLLDPICLYPFRFAFLSSNLHDRFHCLSTAQILQFSDSRLHVYLQCSTKCVTLYLHTYMYHIHTPTPCSLNCIWLNSKKASGPALRHQIPLVQLLQGDPNPWPGKRAGPLVLQLPQTQLLALLIPPHHAATGSPGLSRTRCSQPPPLLRLPEVCGMDLQAFSFWKTLTHRKFSRFPGWKPDLYISNAGPYFQFFPFTAIPPFRSGNAQLRLSGL